MRLVFVLFVLFSLFLQLYCSKNNNSNAVCLRDLKKVANDVVNSEKWALQSKYFINIYQIFKRLKDYCGWSVKSYTIEAY